MSRDDIRNIARVWAQPVTYLGVGMLVFIYCALAYLLTADRKVAAEAAERRGVNLVRVFEQSILHTFKSIDATLLFLRKTYEANPSAFHLSDWAYDPSVITGLTLDFMIADANGIILDSTVSKAVIGLYRGDHASFRFHANSAMDKLVISEPFITKSTGRWAIILTRRLTKPDGSFAGIVTAFIDPSQLAKHVGKVDLGKNGSFVLINRAGVAYARIFDGQFDWTRIGKKLPPTAGIFARVEQAPSGRFWNSPGAFDHIHRLISYQVLESFPLIAAASISREEVFLNTDANARIYWTIAALLTAAILAAIWLGARREGKLIETTSKMEQAREALKQNQDRYRLVEAAVNDGIWDRNLATGEAYLSPRWKQILGYSDDELPNLASSFYDHIHPEDRAAVDDAVRVHMNDGPPYTMDFRLRCKNGDYRWVHARGKVVRDATNRAVRMLGTITDITERRRAEALLEENRNNLARAETMARLGHFKFEKETAALTWSEGAYRIFGKSPESFTPTMSTALAIIHPDDRPMLERIRRELLAGVEPPPFTMRAIRDDGQIVHIESWSKPTRASDGSVSGMFATLQDVTAWKQVEAKLAGLNEELERRVAERTSELAEELRRREAAQTKLAQVQKMEAVGQLTAGIAHDFNNLLAVIRGGLEFVERAAARGLPAEPELIDAALRATRRGADLVQRLLAFSRQSPLKAEPTIVDQLVLDTLRLLQRTLGAEIDIVTRLDASAAAACVDRSQLANALLNMALNARDAMPEGGRLTIATTCRPAPWAAAEGAARWPTGEEICITVSDTGAGMTEEVRKRVFEPFFTTKPDGLGTGLGLSMVHGFVRQSNGHIEIDSVSGQGTTIAIHLPRIEAVSRTAETNAAVASAAAGREKTVLLVEDDPDVRIVTAAQLKQLGYKVHAVANGNEAIDLIESPAAIDVALTDIVLPGSIDGVSLVKEAMYARPGMGVLCMSGYDPTQTHRKWLKVQNIELLEKPFSIVRLAEALDAVLVR